MKKEMTTKRAISILNGLIGGLGIFYVGIAKVWDLPFGDEVLQTTGLIVAFVSTVLGSITLQSIDLTKPEDSVIIEVKNDG